MLLIEAGPDTPPDAVPADIRNTFPSSFFNRDYFWPATTSAIRAGDPQRPYAQPRVMGGGSSVMGMISLRGLPSDFDAWETMGATGWGWQDVLPAYRALADEVDADPRASNRPGPYPVRRMPRERWAGYMHRMEAAAQASGLASHADIYDSHDDGFFALPMAHDDERATSARCWLTAQARARPNLRIMAGTHVARVLFDGQTVTGVETLRGGVLQRLTAPRGRRFGRCDPQPRHLCAPASDRQRT